MTKITLPRNYDENNPEFDIFKNVITKPVYPTKVVKLQNYRVSNNGVIFRFFKVLQDSCISEVVFKKYNSGHKFFLKYILPQFNFFSSKKNFLMIFDEWNDNYYHWHFYALRRLMALKESGLLKNAKILLPKKYSTLPFVAQSLSLFNIKKDQLLFIRGKSNIKVKNLFYCKDRGLKDENLKLQKLLTEQIEPSNKFGDKIYISRKDTKYRYFVNEDEVSSLLEKQGFKTIDTSKISYQEQIAIFKNAKYVVGAHGAGLTNILFMNPGGHLLEIATRSTAGSKPVTDYYRLADAINLNYYYHQCQPHGEVNSYQEWQEGLLAEIPKLEKDVKLMLSN